MSDPAPQTPPAPPGAWGGYLLVFIGVVLFATVEVAVKDANKCLPGGGFPPILFAGIRFTIAGGLFVLLALMNPSIKVKIPSGRDLWYTLLLGIIAAPVAIGLFQFALTFPALKASSAAAIFSINPIFAAFFATLALREKVTTREWIGLMLGFGGAMVMSFTLEGSDRTTLLKAGGVMIASAVMFALNVVLSKPMIRRYGGLCFNGWAFLMGGIVAMLVSLPVEGLPETRLFTLSRGMADIAWVVIAGTAVAYYCYMVGISRVSVTRGSYFFFVKPFLAFIVSLIYLGKDTTIFTAVEWTGFGMIVAGLALIMFYPMAAQALRRRVAPV
ncbi:MAG: DMT family transporter [Planctomycetota bacterium]